MKRRAQPWLGTLVEISIADDVDTAQDGGFASAFAAAFDNIALVHRLMSFHDPASDVARINRAAVGACIDVDAHTACVLAMALVIDDASASIFNIGCASRLAQWEYLPRPANPLPLYQAGDSGLVLCGEGPQHQVRKVREVLIDLGGIAKGYAVDQAILALQQAGIASACVNAGGDLRVLGSNPFAIAIRDPASITGVGATIALTNGALATSAIYFSGRLLGPEQAANEKMSDAKVSALIDGRSGQPVTSACSATVQASECMLADALTKVVIATGNAHHPMLARFGASALLL